jgi:hypothetical protein
MTPTTLPEVQPTAFDNVDPTTSKADIDGQLGDVEMSAPITTAPSLPRPTTGGKSIELLDARGLLKRKRVLLKLPVRQKKVEDDEEADRSAEESADEMEVDTIYVTKEKPRSRKRCRIVSTTMVDSEVEVEVPNRREQNRADGWQTIESERTCSPCADAGADCQSFVQRSRGFR